MTKTVSAEPPVYPKVDLPGQWRWKDAPTFDPVHFDRVIKLQRKGWLFWHTYALSWYKSSQRTGLFGQNYAIGEAHQKALSKYNRNKSVTIYPA